MTACGNRRIIAKLRKICETAVDASKINGFSE